MKSPIIYIFWNVIICNYDDGIFRCSRVQFEPPSQLCKSKFYQHMFTNKLTRFKNLVFSVKQSSFLEQSAWREWGCHLTADFMEACIQAWGVAVCSPAKLMAPSLFFKTSSNSSYWQKFHHVWKKRKRWQICIFFSKLVYQKKS